MKITLLEFPMEKDWIEVKRRAMITIGKTEFAPPPFRWRRDILEARHSPIRYLRFSFLIEGVPSWVATHLARHVHAQPYIKSQRNDRQSEYDRNAARQDVPVDMIFDVNAEEMIVIANKRLCNKAAKETRELVQIMCDCICEHCPEFKSQLIPMCERDGGVCHEMKSCGKCLRNG